MSDNDYFLVYSQGCYSGNIEYDDCFGEVITNNHNDRGAYAYIGNSRYGWYNSGTYVTGASNLMHKEFVEAVFTDNFTRLGEANQIPKATLHSGTYRWIAFETNLLGCPAYDLNPNYCSSDQDCSDGLYCNGLESCDGGVCQEGEPFVCDDGVFCNGQEECVEGDEQAVCVSSGDPCEPPLMCDEDTGSCTECLADGDCDDGEVCTTDRCDMGECGNIWPACGQQDGCCDPDCNGQEEDPDCLCGNDLCEPGEDCDSCPKDCISDTGSGTCGACFKGVCNGDCHPNKEGPDCADCSPSYCCGDSFCEGNENSGNCEIDCGSGPGCGDGICDPGENSCNCQLDCGAAPGTGNTRMQLVATAWTMTVMGQSTVATLKTVQVNLLVATAANQKAKNAALIASVVQAAAIPKKGADSYIKGRVRNGPAFFIISTLNTCSKILTVGSEPVISFFKKGNSVSRGLPFLF